MKKLKNLGLHISESPTETCVHNSSTHHFADDEIALLKKGLKHCLFPNFINHDDIKSELEMFYRSALPHIDNLENRLKLKITLLSGYNDLVNTFYRDRAADTYFSKDEQKTLDRLASYKHLVFVKAY